LIEITHGEKDRSYPYGDRKNTGDNRQNRNEEAAPPRCVVFFVVFVVVHPAADQPFVALVKDLPPNRCKEYPILKQSARPPVRHRGATRPAHGHADPGKTKAMRNLPHTGRPSPVAAENRLWFFSGTVPKTGNPVVPGGAKGLMLPVLRPARAARRIVGEPSGRCTGAGW
jgi:hypothetical protein